MGTNNLIEVDKKIIQIDNSISEILNRNLQNMYQNFDTIKTIREEILIEVKRILNNKPLNNGIKENKDNFR